MSATAESGPGHRLESEAALGPLAMQLEELRRHVAAASVVPLPDGSALVAISDVPLPPGWSHAATTVWFVAPVGFPMARPDCFWIDSAVKLASGNAPTNTQLQACPGSPEPKLWFSWHLQSWNPATDRLLTYFRVIQERLRRVH